MRLTDEQVKEIADQLDCGFRVFVHKQTGALLSIPDFDNYPYAEEYFYKEELVQLDKHFLDYWEIDWPQPYDSFEFMRGFAEQIDNKQLQGQLLTALTNRKPFQAFKHAIASSGQYRQQWFSYKAEQLKKWVVDRFAETQRPCDIDGSV